MPIKEKNEEGKMTAVNFMLNTNTCLLTQDIRDCRTMPLHVVMITRPVHSKRIKFVNKTEQKNAAKKSKISFRQCHQVN
jgi:hypothetical protein